MREAGKGSKPRPYSVSKDRFNSNWDNTFKKTVKLENPLNQEIWHCNDYNDIHFVDGVEYIRVFKQEFPSRVHLMRKTALQKKA